MKYYHSYNKPAKAPEKKDEELEEPVVVSKMNETQYQKMRIEKLFKNPDRVAAVYEESQKPVEPRKAPQFVRNVWGSAAGVGSGDFHVYRGVRRREFQRQEIVKKELEDERILREYNERKQKQEEEAEAKTAKKRAKRQKNKERMKKKRKATKTGETEEKDSSSESDSDNVPTTE
ncbi:PRKR-interacting protein 1, partial [Cichlidogyrus casuarinus]